VLLKRNNSIWHLAVKKKIKKHFDFEAGQDFAFTAIDAPGCWYPRRFFSFFECDTSKCRSAAHAQVSWFLIFMRPDSRPEARSTALLLAL
jgi:hypothetical protein